MKRKISKYVTTEKLSNYKEREQERKNKGLTKQSENNKQNYNSKFISTINYLKWKKYLVKIQSG